MNSHKIKTTKISPIDISNIRYVKGAENISSSYPAYLVDESKISGGIAEWLFFPATETEAISVIKYLDKNNIPLTISAARTGIVGSCIPTVDGGAIISLERMNNFIGIGYDDEKNKWFARCQPGVTLNELNNILKTKKLNDDHNLSEETNYVEEFKNATTHFYPVDPTEMSASIGGTIATNASGAKTFRYGPTRDWIKRIRVILPNGELLDIKRGQCKAKEGVFEIEMEEKTIEIQVPDYQMPEAKNAAGLYAKPDMDLIDLFIGSEGLFGVISEVEAWLTEYKSQIANVGFFDNEPLALEFVDLLRNNEDIKPEFIEFFDVGALDLLRKSQKEDPKFVNMPPIPEKAQAAISFDLAYSEEKLEEKYKVIAKLFEECDTPLENSWCGYEERELARFKHFRHAVPEIVNTIIAERKKQYPGIHKLGTDMSVKDEHLKDIMAFYHKTLRENNLEYVIWGHIGDNHVHVNILPRNMEELDLGKQLYKLFAKKALNYGGSVSAEHGIGKIKREYLQIMFGDEGINQMKQVKRAFDPLMKINRGNVFPIEVN